MAWGDMRWGVKVYIWEFDPRGLIGQGNVGHSAILICTDGTSGTRDKTTYLSWWPKGGEGGLGNYEHDRPVSYGSRGLTHVFENKLDVPDQVWQTDKGKHRENASATWKFRIEAGISPNLMHEFVDELVAGSVKTSFLAKPKAYNFATQNCSTTVAHCLRAGGADVYVDWPDYSIWTPNNVYSYTRNLAEVIAAKYPGKARATR